MVGGLLGVLVAPIWEDCARFKKADTENTENTENTEISE
jgi:hypothetical protein